MWRKDFKVETSWQDVGDWYQDLVGEKGHYYHQTVILPNLKRLLALKPDDKIIEFGCGQGVIGRNLASGVEYLGIDGSPGLVTQARVADADKNHQYEVGDVTAKMRLETKYTQGLMVLAMQNMKSPFKAVRNMAQALKKEGRMILVLNHPAFRVPRHSNWMEKEGKQWRIVDSYLTPLTVPIESSPFDKRDNQITWSFHWPISYFTEIIYDNGMVTENMEEWVSPKKSTGSKAKIEDRSRSEFPLFLTIVAKKL